MDYLKTCVECGRVWPEQPGSPEAIIARLERERESERCSKESYKESMLANHARAERLAAALEQANAAIDANPGVAKKILLMALSVDEGGDGLVGAALAGEPADDQLSANDDQISRSARADEQGEMGDLFEQALEEGCWSLQAEAAADRVNQPAPADEPPARAERAEARLATAVAALEEIRDDDTMDSIACEDAARAALREIGAEPTPAPGEGSSEPPPTA